MQGGWPGDKSRFVLIVTSGEFQNQRCQVNRDSGSGRGIELGVPVGIAEQPQRYRREERRQRLCDFAKLPAV
jgi:hypothetical protein